MVVQNKKSYGYIEKLKLNRRFFMILAWASPFKFYDYYLKPLMEYCSSVWAKITKIKKKQQDWY